jgi:hypothetical protein
MNVVAGVDVHVRTVRLVVRVEIDGRVVGDCAVVRTISTVPDVCATGRDFMDVDGVCRRGKFDRHLCLASHIG